MQTTKTKGCGCDGGRGCTGGCGCKPAHLPEAAPAPCSPCETASFVRPRFFAGQLLTEDDLSALVDYTVAKQRFHSSRLFGAGVVCGLEVECGPCDGTHVVVKPGYALDCCGNDLVLACERTLDVAPMIRELQARLKGSADCTDPCIDGEQQEKGRPRRYCLYAVYAERLDQPVTSYPVGDDCDAARCEPTRVIEGVTFELRCPPPAAPDKTMKDATAACKPKPERYAALKAMAVSAASVANRAAPAKVQLPLADELYVIVTADPLDVDATVADAPAADRFVERMRVAMKLAPLLARAAREKPDLPHDKLDRWTRYVARIVDEYDTSTPESADPLFRLAAGQFVQMWKAHGTSGLKKAHFEARVWNKELSRASADHLQVMASRLQELAGCGRKTHTDCELRELVDRLSPTWNPDHDDEESQAKATRQLDEGAKLVQRFVADCECAAINPPCTPCEDRGVLLACFHVDHCKVVRICNSDRHHVLAPKSQRYWGAVAPPDSSACPGPCDERMPVRRHGVAINPERFEMLQIAAARRDDYVIAAPRSEQSFAFEVAALRLELAKLKARLDELEQEADE